MHSTNYPQLILSQSEAAIKIDDFVQEILYSPGLAYKVDSNSNSNSDEEINPRLKHYVRYLRVMVDVFNGWTDYDFSEHLELFNDTRLEIRLEDLDSHFTCPAPDDSFRFLSEAECINLLVERIRENSRSIRYLRGTRDRAYESRMQTRDLGEYVSGVMSRYARTLVVRVNLYYRGVSKPWLRAEDVFAARNRLAGQIGRNEVFEHLSGYVLRIEQADRQGFHIHAAFFFNASEVQNEAYRAKKIGELWIKVTHGKGFWHDSGRAWLSKHGRGGQRTTGVFKRTDTDACFRVARYMSYLAKTSQYLRIKPENGRAYSTGQLPRGRGF